MEQSTKERAEKAVACILDMDNDLLAKIFSGMVLLGMQVCKTWCQEFPVYMHIKIRVELEEGWQDSVQTMSQFLYKFRNISTFLSIRQVTA